jgi:hypothetical protein
MDGGAKWTNVTPGAIKPWTRIFNIEAGHFDTNTAYAAANTMRIDDMNPHFWRTHDGGKTWTEINTGIAPGAVANSIREDPKVKGLLYGSTDTQVWVSFDDGNHWQSLRINMPAISVRDIQLKDDSACLCSDLVAGTHGRGFWILDNVTPLRAMATTANARTTTYLVKPATAVRVRFANNEPTPWPPDQPAGENPPAGAVIDYNLAADAREVKLEFIDAGGKIIRSYSSNDTIPGPDPALHPEEYNRVCQRNPAAPRCSVPLYWAAPNLSLSSRAGMHRFTWDMRYQPLDSTLAESATGAVPHRLYYAATTPWVPPGSYTVRLVVDGKTYAQPLRLVLDPRVKTPASAIAQVSSLSREMYDGALTLRAAYDSARVLSARVSDTALKAELDSIAPAAARGQRQGFGFRQGPVGPPNLESARAAMMSAAMSMQDADAAPTERELDAAARARGQYREVIAKWNALKGRR